MSAPVIFALPGNERLADVLANQLAVDPGRLTVRRFPDGETYVRIETPVAGREAILVCTLDRPDDKVLPLLFLAATARELSARRVGLVAPYLAYMRQDRRFVEGEGVTSAYFAELISRAVSWLVTVDPHLHRRGALGDIYPIPHTVISAAPRISAWIRENVTRPLLVGPDSESVQWVRAVAEDAGAPFVVLEKIRRGDRDVQVSVPNVDEWRDRTPVLVDDIISTARTMIETVGHLRRAGLAPPVCVGVHGVFAEDAFDQLLAAGAARVVTSNSIPHPSNAIDLTPLLADAIGGLLPSTSPKAEAGAAARPRMAPTRTLTGT
jgi:ribose-phosphate pyrophosphokinase